MLKDRIFNNIDGLLKEFYYGYISKIAFDKQYLITKSIARFTNNFLNSNTIFKPYINKKSLDRLEHLAKPADVKLMDDMEYIDSVVCRAYPLFADILESLKLVPLKFTTNNVNNILGTCAKFFRDSLTILNIIETSLIYTLQYLDIFSDDFIYLKYVACTADIIYELDTNTLLGTLTCTKENSELLQTTLERYVAITEFAESKKELDSDYSHIKKFFN